jgi:hypothetical protein
MPKICFVAIFDREKKIKMNIYMLDFLGYDLYLLQFNGDSLVTTKECGIGLLFYFYDLHLFLSDFCEYYNDNFFSITYSQQIPQKVL